MLSIKEIEIEDVTEGIEYQLDIRWEEHIYQWQQNYNLKRLDHAPQILQRRWPTQEYSWYCVLTIWS